MIASSARVDDDARARSRLRVSDNLTIRDLPRATFAPQLADRLDVQRPTLHVGVGEVAAVGVGGEPPTDLERPAFDENSGLAALAEAKTLEAEQNRRAEIVVAHEGIDILAAGLGRCKRVVRGRRDLGVPGIELEVFYRRCAIGFPSAETTDEHGRLGQVRGAFLGRQDETNRAIIDEAIIEETQRRDNETRSFVVFNGHRRFHDRVWMKLRMMAKDP